MIQSLRKMRLRMILLVAIQLLLIIAVAVVYSLDLFGFRQYISNDALVIGVSLLTIIDIAFVWFSTRHIYRIRQKTDLKAAEIIGSDVQEAYNFGMIGLVVVDENNIVLWINDLLTQRQISILDSNILDWQPKLRELMDGDEDKTVKVEINNRNYEVKYLPDALLYIFKDITDAEHYYNDLQAQAPVVGVIMIDNYADVSINVEDNNDVVLNIRNSIFEYAKQFGMLLRRYRNDAYFALCNYESFSKMKNDGFSILDRVRVLGSSNEPPLTLQMGFAHNTQDFLRLNELATNAIDIAMSRGGDQVVVSRFGEDLAFYGGKTEAQEKRNKVKVRVLADTLVGLMKNSSNVLIMAHTDMDMDALGSSLGVKAMADSIEKPALIVYDSKLTEKKTKGALTTMFSKEELAKMVISPHDCLSKLKANTLVVLCDVHKPSMTMYPKLLEEANKVVVIDHHRREDEFVESPVFSYMEPSASSASELVTELIHYSSNNQKMVIPSSFATIMLSGIFLDSNYFRTTTAGMRTFEASMILREFGANNTMADDFLKDEYEEQVLVNKIMANSKTPYYGVVVSKADPKDFIDRSTLAKVANRNMQIKGVICSFVIGNTGEKETRLSARSDGSVNVQLITEKIGGGGRFSQAAAAFNNTSIDEVEKRLVEILETYLAEASNKNQQKKE